MTLREQLESKRTELGVGPNPFYATKDRATVLRVEEASGVSWMLPWNHFIIGRHAQAGAGEQLILTFVSHEVTLGGLNLGTLLPEIANQRLESLRTAPGKYLRSTANEPAIDQIRVRSLSTSTEGE